MKACCQPLHEDTFGGNLKVGLAQVAAMEISKGNHRDNKAVVRYLPWLYHPPSTMQQGYEWQLLRHVSLRVHLAYVLSVVAM